MRREWVRWGESFFDDLYLHSPAGAATFKAVVLRRREELVGPSQHSIIRITWYHGLPDEFRAFLQL